MITASSRHTSLPATEAALLTVQTNIFLTLEKKDYGALRLLDLSALFDMIDHNIVLDRLKEWFGVALDWVVSFLSPSKSDSPDSIQSKPIFMYPPGFGARTTPVY